MIATKVTAEYVVGKSRFVVTVERENTKSDIEVTILCDGEQVEFRRLARCNAFGSGVCRSALDDYRHGRSTGQPLKRANGTVKLKPARPRLAKGTALKAVKSLVLLLAMLPLVGGCSGSGTRSRTVTLYGADGAVIREWKTSDPCIFSNGSVVLTDASGKKVEFTGTYIIQEN